MNFWPEITNSNFCQRLYLYNSKNVTHNSSDLSNLTALFTTFYSQLCERSADNTQTRSVLLLMSCYKIGNLSYDFINSRKKKHVNTLAVCKDLNILY